MIDENAKQETVEAETDAVESAEAKMKKKLSTKALTFIAIGAIIFAGALGGVSANLYKSYVAQSNGQSQLDDAKQSYGDMTIGNETVTTFKGQVIENADAEQKALVRGKDGSESAVFIFTNGKQSESKKIVDLYADFGSGKSRDFILLNQTSLKAMVENGLIELRVHPVASGNAFSMYAPEALAETVVSKPAATWDTLTGLLKLSATLEQDDNDNILKQVAAVVKENKVENVDEKTVKRGTFSSWIIATGDDAKLKTGYYPPILYVNDKLIDQDKVNINDTNTLQKYILSK